MAFLWFGLEITCCCILRSLPKVPKVSSTHVPPPSPPDLIFHWEPWLWAAGLRVCAVRSEGVKEPLGGLMFRLNDCCFMGCLAVRVLFWIWVGALTLGNPPCLKPGVVAMESCLPAGLCGPVWDLDKNERKKKKKNMFRLIFLRPLNRTILLMYQV